MNSWDVLKEFQVQTFIFHMSGQAFFVIHSCLHVNMFDAAESLSGALWQVHVCPYVTWRNCTCSIPGAVVGQKIRMQEALLFRESISTVTVTEMLTYLRQHTY